MVALATPYGQDMPGDWLTVALPRPAWACYALFCAVERTPEWLSVVTTAIVVEREPDGSARKVAFLASLRRASIGYSCTYRYHDDERRISWSTSKRSSIVVRGMAQFHELSERSCLVTYALDVRVAGGLPPFADSGFAAHASSATLADFRDFATRTIA
jgi:uncharacterized membrane protein